MPAWEQPVNATGFGADCVNAPWYDRIEAIGFAKQAEECLFLNVGVAGWRESSPKAVEFWIHGGSFVVGGSTKFSPERVLNFYRDDVVVVTANYRLGGLGFLGGAAVAATTPDGSAGNFAFTAKTRARRFAGCSAISVALVVIQNA